MATPQQRNYDFYYQVGRRAVNRRAQQQRRNQQAARSATVMAARQGVFTVPRTMGAAYTTERKYFDTYLSATAITFPNTWAGSELDPAGLNCLFCPSEGADIDNRVGRKVTVHSIRINAVIFCPMLENQTALDNPAILRFILYMDQQTNASQSQGEQLMQDPGAATPLNTINTFTNTQNFGRFKILKDKRLTLTPPNYSWDGTNIEQAGVGRQFKINYNFKKPVVVRFNQTNGGSVADIIDNSFHLIGIGAPSTATLAPVLYYQCRIVYTDK